MKFKLTAFKPDKGVRDFPPASKKARDVVVTSCAPLMHMHGITAIAVTSSIVGPLHMPSSVMSVSESELIPEDLVKVRPFIARRLADILSAFGISELKLMPDTDEQEAMEERWKHLKGESK